MHLSLNSITGRSVPEQILQITSFNEQMLARVPAVCQSVDMLERTVE